MEGPRRRQAQTAFQKVLRAHLEESLEQLLDSETTHQASSDTSNTVLLPRILVEAGWSFTFASLADDCFASCEPWSKLPQRVNIQVSQ